VEGFCTLSLVNYPEVKPLRRGRNYAWRVRSDAGHRSASTAFRVVKDGFDAENSTPSPWAMRYVSDTTNSATWTTAERNEAAAARSAVATMFKRFTAFPNDTLAESFNRVMINDYYVPRILMVRANIPNVNGNAPAVYAVDPVTGNLHFNIVRNGNCAASNSTTGLIPLPPAYGSPKMIICNGTFTPTQYTFVHEFGHLFDYSSDIYLGSNAPISLTERVAKTFQVDKAITDCLQPTSGVVMGFFDGFWRRGGRGWGTGPARQPNGNRLVTTFQQNSDNNYVEAAADMFLNYVYRGNSANEGGPVACGNTGNWGGPAFRNRSWLNQTSTIETMGTPDPTLPGDRRQARTRYWMNEIFSPGQHPNW